MQEMEKVLPQALADIPADPGMSKFSGLKQVLLRLIATLFLGVLHKRSTVIHVSSKHGPNERGRA